MNVTFLSPSPSPIIISLCLRLLSCSDFAMGRILTGYPWFRADLYLALAELGYSIARNLLASPAAEVLLSDLPGDLYARI